MTENKPAMRFLCASPNSEKAAKARSPARRARRHLSRFFQPEGFSPAGLNLRLEEMAWSEDIQLDERENGMKTAFSGTQNTDDRELPSPGLMG
jgi:hypothetical protein